MSWPKRDYTLPAFSLAFFHCLIGWFTGYFSIMASFDLIPLEWPYWLGFVGALGGGMAYCYPTARRPLYALCIAIWILIPINWLWLAV